MEVEGSVVDVVTQEPTSSTKLMEEFFAMEENFGDAVTQEPTLPAKVMENPVEEIIGNSIT